MSESKTVPKFPAVPATLMMAAFPMLLACGAASEDDPYSARQQDAIMIDEPTRWTFSAMPVCVVGGTSSLRTEARLAIQKSWFQVADLPITCPGSCPTTGQWVRIDLAAVSTLGGIGGLTGGFPSPVSIIANYCDPGLSDPDLGEDCFSWDGIPVDPLEQFRAVVIHEFGHALGFWHEHQRSDRPSDLGTWCPPANLTDPSNNGIQNGTWLTDEYDAHSIMNYCRDQNDDEVVDGFSEFPADRLSIGDMVGVANGYGYRYPAFMHVTIL